MGLTAAFLGAFFSSFKDLVSKQISFSVDGTVSAFASFLFSLPYYVVTLFLLYMLGYERFSMSGTFVLLVVLRSLTDAVAEGFKMHAFSHGDISVVSCFLSLSPLFLLLISPAVTGDPITVSGVIAIGLVVAGSLVLVYQPPGKANPISRKGLCFGLGASLFFSLNSCFDRLAVQVASPAWSGFAMTVLAALFLMPFVVVRQRCLQQLSQHAKPFWLRGFFELAYMVSKLYALQFLQAPQVVGIGKLALLLSIIGGRVFFKDVQFGRRLAAGLLIVAGVLVIVFAEFQ
jgi:drug/metabolite transporter (DMT)-like permease